MKTQTVYNGRLGAIDTCYTIETGDRHTDTIAATIYEQCPGPVGGNAKGKTLGYGTGKTVSDALESAKRDAIRNLTDRDNPR